MSCTIYIHNDRKRPKFVIPLMANYFLSWTASDIDDDTVTKTNWVLRHRDKDLPEALGKSTIEDIFKGSLYMREATALEVLLYTNQPSNLIEETVEKYRRMVFDSVDSDGLDSEKLNENYGI